VRVHELARELGVASKDIIEALEAMGLEGRTASSSVPDEAVPRLRASGGKPVPGAKPPKAATEAPLPPKRKAPAAKEPAEAPAAEAAAPEGNGQVAPAPVAEAPAAEAPAVPAAAEPEAPAAPAATGGKVLRVARGSTPQEVAAKVGLSPAEVVKTLFGMGEMVKPSSCSWASSAGPPRSPTPWTRPRPPTRSTKRSTSRACARARRWSP
jgi:translation initiation factor IF-2